MTPFHAGELAIQRAAGESDRAAKIGRMIASHVPAGALPFLNERAWIVLGTVDASGQPWASSIYGWPGFVSSDNGATVVLDWQQVVNDPADAVRERAAVGSSIAMIALEPETRRRLRVNGRISANSGDELVVSVEEAFSNCPKYIQARALISIDRESADFDIAERTGHGPLDDAAKALVTEADTFFIASHGPSGSADISHRGGVPGFARIDRDGDLVIPDYTGNSLFNTLGNLSVDPRAGLLFPDFGNSVTLQIAGRARSTFGEPDPHGLTGGTGRFWRFTPETWRSWRSVVRPTWEFIEASPYCPVPA